MKKIILTLVATLLIGAICAACTPGALVDTLNGLGASPGNIYSTRGNGGITYSTRGNAG
jgi:hypothetical protein